MKAMALSGGLCGLAGGIEYMALSGTIDTGFPQQWGFLAIPVALLGFLDPIGVVLSAFYFGALSLALSRWQDLVKEVRR